MPLNNFGIVAQSPLLVRSAQFDHRSAASELKGLGIQHVVKLSNDLEYPITLERELTTALGISVARFSIDQWFPQVNLVRAVASWIESKRMSGESVLVHCMHGRDRTGLVIGAWRLLFDGWDLPAVLAELELYGVVGIVKLADHEIIETLRKLAHFNDPFVGPVHTEPVPVPKPNPEE